MTDTEILDWIQSNASKLGIKPQWTGYPSDKPNEPFEYTDIREMVIKAAAKEQLSPP
jgi:hypothetical protein